MHGVEIYSQLGSIAQKHGKHPFSQAALSLPASLKKNPPFFSSVGLILHLRFLPFPLHVGPGMNPLPAWLPAFELVSGYCCFCWQSCVPCYLLVCVLSHYGNAALR